VIGFIEFGLIFFVNSVLEGATNVGSRIGKTGLIPNVTIVSPTPGVLLTHNRKTAAILAAVVLRLAPSYVGGGPPT
jgi:hypothetical protein